MDNKVMITVDEEELFDIMCDYAEIEHKLHYFLIVLNALKDHYDGEMMKDVYANLMVIIGYLTFQLNINRMLYIIILTEIG